MHAMGEEDDDGDDDDDDDENEIWETCYSGLRDSSQRDSIDADKWSEGALAECKHLTAKE